MNNSENLEQSDQVHALETNDVMLEFWRIERNCDVSDILKNAGIEIDAHS